MQVEYLKTHVLRWDRCRKGGGRGQSPMTEAPILNRLILPVFRTFPKLFLDLQVLILLEILESHRKDQIFQG